MDFNNIMNRVAYHNMKVTRIGEDFIDIVVKRDAFLPSVLIKNLVKNINAANPEESKRFRVNRKNPNMLEDTYQKDSKGHAKVIIHAHYENEM